MRETQTDTRIAVLPRDRECTVGCNMCKASRRVQTDNDTAHTTGTAAHRMAIRAWRTVRHRALSDSVKAKALLRGNEQRPIANVPKPERLVVVLKRCNSKHEGSMRDASETH